MPLIGTSPLSGVGSQGAVSVTSSSVIVPFDDTVTGDIQGVVPGFSSSINAAHGVSGTSSVSLDVLAGTINAVFTNPAVSGSISGTLPLFTSSVTVSHGTVGGLSSPTPGFTGAFAGVSGVSGNISSVIPGFSSSITGAHGASGTVSSGLPGLTGTVAGAHGTSGTVSSGLPSVTGALVGSQGVGGALAGLFPGISGAVTGARGATGSLVSLLPGFTGVITSVQFVSGTIASQLPGVVGNVAGAHGITAMLLAMGPGITGSVVGHVDIPSPTEYTQGMPTTVNSTWNSLTSFITVDEGGDLELLRINILTGDVTSSILTQQTVRLLSGQCKKLLKVEPSLANPMYMPKCVRSMLTVGTFNVADFTCIFSHVSGDTYAVVLANLPVNAKVYVATAHSVSSPFLANGPVA